MHVRFIYHAAGPLRMICSAELVFDEGDGPLAGLWLRGFGLWRWGNDEVQVTLPYCPFGAPKEWWFFEHLRGDAAAIARLKAFVREAWENRGALWTCPGCHRMQPEPQPRAGSVWTCGVCKTLARAPEQDSPILDLLTAREAPPPLPARRVHTRRRRPSSSQS